MTRKTKKIVSIDEMLKISSQIVIRDETSGENMDGVIVRNGRTSDYECLSCEKPLTKQMAIMFNGTEDFQVCMSCVNANLVNRTYTIVEA